MLRLAFALAILSIAAMQPADAQTRARSERVKSSGDIRIGVGHGIGFLPLYLASDLKLFDKHAKAAGLPQRIVVERYNSAAPLRQAMNKGELAAGAVGLSAFLLARETPKPMVAISGVTTLPLVLLTAQPNIRSISDFRPGQRIAVPLSTSPQLRYLRLQADQLPNLGLWTRLQQQLVIMPHQDALEAMTVGKRELSSVDVLGGKSSFFVIAASRTTLAANPKLAEVVAKAIDEASAIIGKDPKRAAVTWLKYEPSHSFDVRAVEAVLRDLKDEFGSGVYGVSATAALMNREGKLNGAVANWKDVVAPVIAAGPGS
jgi:NitT/TauT family transport system substrate-binding protein